MEDVAAGDRLARALEREARLEEEAVDERPPQERRVLRHARLERRDHAVRIVQRAAVVHLRQHHVPVESVRMPDLVVTRRPSRLAVGDRALHQVEVGEEPVDAPALDHEPRPAVDPRPPRPEVGDRIRRMAVVELLRQPAERGEGRAAGRAVVDAEVDVGVRVGVAPGLRPAEDHGGDAVDVAETGGDAGGEVGRHGCSSLRIHPRRVRTKSSRSCSRCSLCVQNSIVRGTTRNPVQVGGRGIGRPR